MTDAPADQPHVCSACRILDAADGRQDDLIFGAQMAPVRSENSILHKLRRAEDEWPSRLNGRIFSTEVPKTLVELTAELRTTCRRAVPAA